MKKSMMILKGLIFAIGLVLSQLAFADDLRYKITKNTRIFIKEFYHELLDLKNTNSRWDLPVKNFLFTLKNSDHEDQMHETSAYNILLPKFFEILKIEATKQKSRWFKSSYTKSEWWQALDEKEGKSNKFMAYLYNINGVNTEKQWTDLGMKLYLSPLDKTTLHYVLNGKWFHQESISFFKRHWGKLALAGVLVAGAGVAAWKYRDRLGYPSASQKNGYVHLDRSEMPGDKEKTSMPNKPTVLYSPLEKGEREERSPFLSRLREKVTRFGERAQQGQEERLARTTDIGHRMIEGGKNLAKPLYKKEYGPGYYLAAKTFEGVLEPLHEGKLEKRAEEGHKERIRRTTNIGHRMIGAAKSYIYDPLYGNKINALREKGN